MGPGGLERFRRGIGFIENDPSAAELEAVFKERKLIKTITGDGAAQSGERTTNEVATGVRASEECCSVMKRSG